MADDADVAESIVEQAVGALLPFSQTASSSSSKASKGLAGRGTGSKKNRMMSTGGTSIGMTATADARTLGALPRVGRATSGVGGGGQSGEDRSETAVGRKHGGDTGTGRDNGSYQRGASRGEEVGAASFLGLNPASSPTPPRRGEYRDAAATPGVPLGSQGGGRGTKKERENADRTRSSHEGNNRLDKGLHAATTRSKEIGRVDSGGGDSYGGGGGGLDEAEGYVVLLTPTLAQIATLVEALEAPQLPTMGFVVVCPMYDWNQEQDEVEIRRLRKFPQVGNSRAGGI